MREGGWGVCKCTPSKIVISSSVCDFSQLLYPARHWAPENCFYQSAASDWRASEKQKVWEAFHSTVFFVKCLSVNVKFDTLINNRNIVVLLGCYCRSKMTVWWDFSRVAVVQRANFALLYFEQQIRKVSLVLSKKHAPNMCHEIRRSQLIFSEQSLPRPSVRRYS